MPYDEALTNRMRRALAAHVGISERRMMGGVCFFLNGNMLSGARHDKDGNRRFMFRVGRRRRTRHLPTPRRSPLFTASVGWAAS